MNMIWVVSTIVLLPDIDRVPTMMDDTLVVLTLTVKVLVRHGVDGPGSTLVAMYGPQVMVTPLQAPAT